MSGIAGIIHFGGAPVEPGLIETMSAAMAHRGPDGIRHWVKGPVALGQCMLRTTPESLEETQPLTNEDESLALVMDGRVDNWAELRRDLVGQDARLRDRSDAELVLRSYETWGEGGLTRVEGDFAFVIWDARRRTAFCARDRTGARPFFYHWHRKTLVFASEKHAILAVPGVPRALNRAVLAEFLAAEWHSRRETLLDGILRLLAAHRMTVRGEEPEQEEYWRPDLKAPLPPRRDEEWCEHYRELLADSVRRLCRSQKPVACEVSGGLDSSAVFCVAEHLRRSGSLPAPSVEGFTLAFSDEGEADERAYARAVGEHLGVEVREAPPSAMALPWYTARARSFCDFPGYPNGTMALGLMREAQGRGSRVLLNGIGGDEWLGGSRAYYGEELNERRWRTLRACFSADAAAFGTRQAAAWFGRHGVLPLLPPRLKQFARRLLGRGRDGGFQDPFWLSPELRDVLDQQRARSAAQPVHEAARAGQAELLGHLSDAYHGLAAEMTESFAAETGLEVRRPLYTPAMIQFAFASPARLRLRGNTNKYMHLQALGGMLPGIVRKRTTKAEFSIVFRQHLDRMSDTLCREIAASRADWLSPQGASRVYRAYHEDRRAYWPAWVLWGLYGCDRLLVGLTSPPPRVVAETPVAEECKT